MEMLSSEERQRILQPTAVAVGVGVGVAVGVDVGSSHTIVSPGISEDTDATASTVRPASSSTAGVTDISVSLGKWLVGEHCSRREQPGTRKALFDLINSISYPPAPQLLVPPRITAW